MPAHISGLQIVGIETPFVIEQQLRPCVELCAQSNRCIYQDKYHWLGSGHWEWDPAELHVEFSGNQLRFVLPKG
jgi:hypothetical protein